MASNTTVFHLKLSDRALDIAIGAIATLSRKTRKFVNLRDVVFASLNEAATLPPDALERFADLLPLDGPNRIFFRVSDARRETLEQIKEGLSAHTGTSCSMREALCFCCLVMSGKEF